MRANDLKEPAVGFVFTRQDRGLESEVPSLSASLGHTLNTLRHVITKRSHHVLSKLRILCWATFIAILGHMWPSIHRVDTAGRWKVGHFPHKDGHSRD